MTAPATQRPDLLTHLDALRDDLAAFRENLVPAHRILLDAGLAALTECSAVGHKYANGEIDGTGLHRGLILAVMDFSLKWETWLDSGVRFRHTATLVFHRLLLRAVKGAIKRWRLWRVDLVGIATPE